MATFLILFNIAIFLSAVMIISYAYKLKYLSSIRWLMGLVSIFCFIAFCVLNVYLQPEFQTKVLFSRARYLGICFLAPFWLYFIASIFNFKALTEKTYLKLFFFFVPVITFILCLNPATQNLVIREFEPTTVSGLSVVKFSNGPWFPFYYISNLVTVLIALLIGIYLYFKISESKRRQILVLNIGCLVSILVDIYVVYTNTEYRWVSISTTTFLIALGAIVISIYKHHLLEITPFALEKIFNQLPDPILIVNKDYLIQEANTKAQAVFALPKSYQGQRLDAAIPALKESNLEIKVNGNDNIPRHYYWTKEALFFESNVEPIGQIHYFREITAQKDMEEKLNGNIEFKARMISLLAHDLTANIENQIQLSSAVVEHEMHEIDLIKEKMNLLNQLSSSAQGLMSNLLSWAKTESSNFHPEVRAYEINTLIRECIENLEPSSKIKNITVHFSTFSQPLIVYGDSLMIAAIIRNILANAVKACKQDGLITVVLNSDTEKVLLRIKDDGIGMTEEQLQKAREVRDDFWGAQNSKRDGFGIGLAIVQKFLTLHNGKIHFSTSVDKGTEVAIHIPLKI